MNARGAGPPFSLVLALLHAGAEQANLVRKVNAGNGFGAPHP